MPEQLQKILNKVIEWWKKFNNQQRVLIGSVTAVVLIALGILAFVMTTPSTVVLYRCGDYSEAAKIRDILDSDDSISYEFDEDTMCFVVTEEDEAAASMLLGASEIELANYSIDNVVDGSFTRTEADKQKLYKEFLEKKFADHISQLSIVESCSVDVTIPEDDGTILSRDEKSSAAVSLVLNKNMNSDQAYALALYISTQLGNDTTEGITIIDSNCNVLYSGADSQSSIGIASTQLTFTEKVENAAVEEIRDILVKTHVFSDVQVAMNMSINFDTTHIVKTEFGIPNGMDGGAITQQSLYDFVSNQGYEGGVPGTDTNDDTTYVIEDGEYGYTEISESDTTYDYDRMVTTIQGHGGDIDYDACSASVIATKYIVYDEASLRASGALDDMTWEEFKAANSGTRVVEVDDMYVQAVATATGFSANDITFLCYEEPRFIPIDDSGRTISDYAQIIIAVLIFALLGFVVFRSTRSPKTEELQPEISVESLLESTSTAQEELEDIGYAEKSEVRLMIEKFVDENPEAVAQLLRNWLNEDWE